MAKDPLPHVPVLPGWFRLWCWHGCGWWREVPAMSLDRSIGDRERHVATEHPEPEQGGSDDEETSAA